MRTSWAGLRPSWEHLGPSWAVGSPERIQRRSPSTAQGKTMFWASSGSPGVILDASWAASVASWRPLGALLGYLEAMLGRLGTILDVMEPSWRPSWAPSRSLGPSWEPLGPFGAVSGLSGRPLGRSSGPPGGSLGALLGRLGSLLGRLGAVLGASWAVLGRSRRPLGPSWSVGSSKRREGQKRSNTSRK